jgi:hypothetical protein
MAKEDELIKALKAYEFDKALNILKSGGIDIVYKDEGDNTIVHIFIAAIIDNICSFDKLGKDVVMQLEETTPYLLSEKVKSLLNLLIEENSPFGIANNENLFPLDLFIAYKKEAVQYSDISYDYVRGKILKKPTAQENGYFCYMDKGKIHLIYKDGDDRHEVEIPSDGNVTTENQIISHVKDVVYRSRLDMLNTAQAEIVKILDNANILTDGKKYVCDFTLRIESKKSKEKDCNIPDSWIEISKKEKDFDDNLSLTLHQRLSLAREYFEGKKSVDNMVVANIGFVVSQADWSKGMHSRKFATFPLEDKKYIILGKSAEGSAETHSEDEVIRFLNDNVAAIVEQLASVYLPNSKYKRKVYAVVLDLNSTNEVCSGCTIKLRNLQKNYEKDDFMYKLQVELHSRGFILPNRSLFSSKKESNGRSDQQEFMPNRPVLRLIIRASGVDFYKTSSFAKKDEQYIPESTLKDECERNIKKHSLGILFHLPHRKHKDSGILAGKYNLSHQKSLGIFETQGFFSLYCQTGFANSGGGNGGNKTTFRNGAGDGMGILKVKDAEILSDALKR